MRHLSFEGVFPILQTPFNEKGEIAFDEVENEVDWLIEKGVHGIGIAIASEIFKLNDIEKFQLLKTVVEKSSGKIPVIMNSGQESTEYTKYISKKSEELGAKGLMIKPPVFDNAPQKYIGLDRFEARKKIINDLKEKSLIEKIENIKNVIPY